MDQQDFALTVIVFSVFAGVFITPQADLSTGWENLQNDLGLQDGTGSSTAEVPQIPGLTLGSAHEHAQFFVNINGTEKSFTGKEFQLQSYYAHLENKKPHIVHKHSENVTWSFFLNSIDVNITGKNSQNCISFPGTASCGNLSVVLNGQEIQNLNREIHQGANLALIMPPSENLTERYMQENLPREYTRDRGTPI